MTDTSFLRHIEFLVFRNRQFSEVRIHLLFLLEKNHEYSYTTENWNNTLKDVKKIQLKSKKYVYAWK